MKETTESPTSQLPEVFGETALSRQVATPEIRWEADRAFSIDRLLTAFWRRKWLFLLAVVVVSSFQAFRSLRVMPLYRASSTLQIEDERQNLVPYQGFDAPPSPWKYIDTQIERLQSSGFESRLAEQLGRSLNGSLSASQVGATLLVRVSFVSPDPEHAAEVANLAAEQFIREHVQQRVETTGRASNFLQEQLNELEGKVHESEEKILDYAREKSIVNLDDRETMARARLDGLTQETSDAEKQLFDLRAQMDLIERGGSEGLPPELRSQNLDSIEQRLRQIDLDLAGLSVHFGPEWPEVKKLQQEKSELGQQRIAELATIHANLDKSYERARVMHQKLVAELAQQRDLVDKLSEDLIEYGILQREADLDKKLYEGLLQRLKEGGIAASFQGDNIQLVDRARVPRAPFFPNRRAAISQALVVGVLAGLALVVVAELLDNTVKTSEDVTERIGLPALGLIPALGEKKQGGWLRLPWKRFRAGESPPLAFEPGVSRPNPRQEAYRSLRTSILLSHSGAPPRVLLFTSAFPQEGKSTSAVNTAISLAQTGARTVIVDLDLRNSSVASSLGMSDEQGMSTYLSGNSDLASQIRETAFKDLFVVPGGPHPPNPSELIGSAKLGTGLQLLREYFTYVVIDSPPCIGLSDPLLLSRRVDGVILVAQAARTPRRALMRAAHALDGVGATLLGVLLNNVRAQPHLYGYRYGSYGRYYGRYYPTVREKRKTA